MSYCPEDGAILLAVNSVITDECYDCPTCGSHYRYSAEDGALYYYSSPDYCPICGEDETLEAYRKRVRRQTPRN